MPATPTIIGIENALTEAGVAVRKGHITATPDQAAGYEATNVLDETPETSWRTTDTDRDSSRALVRLPQTRYLRTFAGLEHNLGRHGIWRLTADDDYAVRPAVSFDGTSAYGTTTETIPGTADVTLMARLTLGAQAPAHNTAQVVLLTVYNAVGVRFQLILRAGSAGSPWRLQLQVHNWSSVVAISPPTAIYGDGRSRDLVIAYRDSDQLTSFSVDGETATGTASAVWPNNGDERLRIGASSTAGSFAEVTVQDVRYIGRYEPAPTYRAEEQAGTERDLLGSWHFLEGAGTSVADSTGTSAMTLTGGAWVERVNPSPRWSTGAREAWGQWSIRQAWAGAPGRWAKSPVLGSAARNITLAAIVTVADTDALPASPGLVAWYGPIETNAEILLEITATGAIRARSLRFTAGTNFVLGPVINDGQPRAVRAVLNGRDNQLSLYVGALGGTETLQGTASIDPYATLASCRLGVGDSAAAAEATYRVADVRLYGSVRLQADDELSGDVAPHDPTMLAHLRLDGAVTDGVDLSRAYTSGGAAYGEISQTATRALPAGHQRRVAAAADPWARYPRLLVAHAPATVEATELYLELYDPDNADGYLSLAVACGQDAWQPALGREYGARRAVRRLPTKRSADGLLYRERGYIADVVSMTLPQINTDTEADELLARLHRNAPDALVLIIPDPDIDDYRLVSSAVLGEARVDSGLVDPHYLGTRAEIEVVGVRAAP